MQVLYKVMVNDAIRLDCVGEDTLKLKKNDYCIIRNQRHEDYGRVMFWGPVPAGMATTELAQVVRQATLMDQGKAHENAVRSKSLHRLADERIKKRNLPMQLVDTHLTFDRTLVLFMFLAPGRVDFRELLKDLNQAVQTRVELRQIGPRDQAGMVGGIGDCGRCLCCGSFLNNFVSINVKMAKAQEISLNPANIIGACGRLKCCLQYEYEGYLELLGGLPRPGTQCRCQNCEGTIVDRHILLRTVTVQIEDNRLVKVPVGEVELRKR